jgi:hypothetical protein
MGLLRLPPGAAALSSLMGVEGSVRQRLLHPWADHREQGSNSSWADHVLRIQLTGALASWFCPDTVLDPACGNGSVVAAAHHARPIKKAHLSDVSRNSFYFVGTEMRPNLPPELTVGCESIEETLAQENNYDLVVLTEILEHLEDPVSVLKAARGRAKFLVASSPLIPDGCVDGDVEHLWQFDAPGYSEMLQESGWQPIAFIPMTLTPPQFIYDYQIWGAQCDG